MSQLIYVLNNGAVSIFGSVLSASFGNVMNTRRNRLIVCWHIVVLLFLQGWIYSIVGGEFQWQIYPLVMHLPLILMLYILTRKLLWSVISLLFAYLCCQLRRWFALLIVSLAPAGALMQDMVEFAVTLPLLLFLLRFVAPSVRRLAEYPAKSQWLFGIIPAMYYIFDYTTVVYTDLLSSGSPVVVEFMSFMFCAAYLVFLIYNSAEERKRSWLQQVQKGLEVQLSQSVREINALQESHTLARQYRHDLRHHLQYLAVCIENGQREQAQAYISGICKEIEAQKVQWYCENEVANLILSAFDVRAKKNGIAMNVQGMLPAVIKVSDSDLCVLLSNALENAIHACQPFAAVEKYCIIDVQFYVQEGRFFLQVINPCGENVCFENGIPVSARPGHGIGIQSICAIVKRYGGIYTFLVRDGQFILRLSL